MFGCLTARNLLPHPARQAGRTPTRAASKASLAPSAPPGPGRSHRAPEALAVVRGYLADGGPFLERLNISTLFGRFHLDLVECWARWADLAESETAAWPRTAGLGMTDRTRALEEMQTRLQALAAHAAGQSPPGSGGT
jgi:hypothetical protein